MCIWKDIRWWYDVWLNCQAWNSREGMLTVLTHAVVCHVLAFFLMLQNSFFYISLLHRDINLVILSELVWWKTQFSFIWGYLYFPLIPEGYLHWVSGLIDLWDSGLTYFSFSTWKMCCFLVASIVSDKKSPVIWIVFSL